ARPPLYRRWLDGPTRRSCTEHLQGTRTRPDVGLVLLSEVLQAGQDKLHRRVRERADGGADHISPRRLQQFQIFHTSLARLDARQDPVQPVGPFPARSALTTRLVRVEPS